MEGQCRDRKQGLIFADHGVPAREVVDGRSRLDMSLGAPEHLEVCADASTLTGKETYSCLITYHGAAVLHSVKKAGCVVTSTYDLENVRKGRVRARTQGR